MEYINQSAFINEYENLNMKIFFHAEIEFFHREIGEQKSFSKVLRFKSFHRMKKISI